MFVYSLFIRGTESTIGMLHFWVCFVVVVFVCILEKEKEIEKKTCEKRVQNCEKAHTHTKIQKPEIASSV